MKKLILGLMVLAMTFSLVAPAASQAKKPLKIAFVYIGPPGDMGWTYEQDRGRLAIEKQFGSQIETKYIENVPEGPDAERVIRQYAMAGFDMIFTTSFGYMDPTVAVAKEFPNVKFEHCSGYKTAPNMATYFGRIEEARYLTGIIAGRMTKSATWPPSPSPKSSAASTASPSASARSTPRPRSKSCGPTPGMIPSRNAKPPSPSSIPAPT
jgi:basic membrane lipoprotein Med (substrate-binding protein (PBP1-ABC) superfamily)